MTHPANTPASGGDDLPLIYTTAVGEAGDAYLSEKRRPLDPHQCFGNGLPATFRWQELFAVMQRAALAAQPPRPDGGVVPAGVDPHVLSAAQQLSEIQRSQPEWLWFTDDKTDGIPVARYSFGRWAKVEGQAPYIRADLALAAAPPLNTGPEVGGGKLAIAVTALLERFERYRASDKSHYDAHNCFVGDSGAYKIWDAIKSALASARLTPAASRPAVGREEITEALYQVSKRVTASMGYRPACLSDECKERERHYPWADAILALMADPRDDTRAGADQAQEGGR